LANAEGAAGPGRAAVLLKGAAALPALAVPAVAVAAASEPDPIFAAIDRFNEASALEDGAR